MSNRIVALIFAAEITVAIIGSYLIFVVGVGN